MRPDGVLDVTETITVTAEGNKIRHGIYRDFPLTFTDADGHSHRVSFTIRAITRDGKPEPWHKASNQDGIRIYIGDGNVVLDPGTYTYRIHYETGRQIRFLPDHTELFWNVTGNDWAFPILKATALFTLPEQSAADALDGLYRPLRRARQGLRRRGHRGQPAPGGDDPRRSSRAKGCRSCWRYPRGSFCRRAARRRSTTGSSTTGIWCSAASASSAS